VSGGGIEVGIYPRDAALVRFIAAASLDDNFRPDTTLGEALFRDF
jgi:hypothetical protein